MILDNDLGEIKNINLLIQNNEAQVVFDHKDKPEGIKYFFTLNGNIIDIGEEQNFVFTIPEGYSSFDIVQEVNYSNSIPDLRGDLKGPRSFYHWNPPQDEDVVKYLVYNSAGTQLIATLNKIDLHRKSFAEGDQDGIYSVNGNYSGPPVNKTFSTYIIDDNKFTCSLTPGIDFNIGKKVPVGFGVYIDFELEPEVYNLGEEFQFHIGPVNYYLSNPLPNCSHSVKVKSVDSAGNESDFITLTNFIDQRPKTVINQQIDYDGTEIELAWGNQTDSTRTGFKIYTNYSHIYQELTPYCDVLYYESNNPALNSFAFEPEIEGEWLIRIEAVNSLGWESENPFLLELNVNGYDLAEEIDEIQTLSARALPAGEVLLTWEYDWAFGKDATHFEIYWALTEEDLQTALDQNNEEILETITVQKRKYELIVNPGSDNTYYFSIKAAKGDNRSMEFQPFVSVTTDSVAPEEIQEPFIKISQ
jgi:hypothetical protein